MDLRRGMNIALQAILLNLESKVKKVKTFQEIKAIATIAANGDEEIGLLIAELLKNVGKDGTITVTSGKKMSHETEYVKGMKIENGYISPYFITNGKNMKCEFENCHILITNHKITQAKQIIKLLEFANTEHKPIVIIAEDIEGEALSVLVKNKLQNGF